jgi:HTH-type transcriptional regulator/antitoxin HigA
MTDQTFKPDWVSPPGDTISDILEERGISQAEFAKRSGFSKKHVNLLIKGKVAISAEAALRLADVLDAPSEFWLTREANYRSSLESRSRIELLKEHAGWLREIPVADMVRFGWSRCLRTRVSKLRSVYGSLASPAWTPGALSTSNRWSPSARRPRWRRRSGQ